MPLSFYTSATGNFVPLLVYVMSVCDSSKLTESGEGIMGPSDLLPSQTETVGNLGPYYLLLASEAGWQQSCGTEPLACGDI